MAAPTYKCPFKNNGATGITCEAQACGAYNFRKEDCNIIMFFRKQVRLFGTPSKDSVMDFVTDYSSSSSSSSSSSKSSSSSSSSSSSA